MTYSSEVLADTPAGYWRLGEASGTSAADASGSARHGTYVGTPTLGVASVLASDAANTAVVLNGSTQRVTVPASGGAFGAASFTIEAWIKTSTTNKYSAILDRDDGNTQRAWQFRIEQTTGKLQFLRVMDGAGTVSVVSVISSAVVADGMVHHVAATYDGTTIRVYVDGVESGSAAAAGGIRSAPGYGLTIGRSGSSSSNGETDFNGTVDEVAYYGAALSAARIAAHYTAGSMVVGVTQPAATEGIANDATAAVPPGVAAGDLLIWVIRTRQYSAATAGVDTVAAPTGWTRLKSVVVDLGGGFSAVAMGVYSRTATASEPASYTAGPFGSGYQQSAMFAYRGAQVAGVAEAHSTSVETGAISHQTAAVALTTPMVGGDVLFLNVDGFENNIWTSGGGIELWKQKWFYARRTNGVTATGTYTPYSAVHSADWSHKYVSVNVAITAAPSSPYADRVLALSPYGYYALNETSGTTLADGSGNGKDLTSTSAAAEYGLPGALVEGGTAIRWNEGGRFKNDSGGAGSVKSVVAWVKTTNGGNQTLAGTFYSANGNPYFGLQVSGGVAKAFSNGSEAVSPGALVNDGAWHMLAATWETGGALRLYVDGVLVKTTTGTTQLAQSDRVFINQDWPVGVYGTLDAVSMHNVTLTGTEVTSLYSTGSGVAQSPEAVAAFSGSGSLSAVATPVVSASALFSGSGSLSAAAAPVLSSTALFSGSGALSASSTPVGAASALFSGSGSLTAIAETVDFGVAEALFSGTGTLSADAQMVTQAEALFSGAGSLSAVAAPVIAVEALFSGSGSLTAVAQVAQTWYEVDLSTVVSLSNSVAYDGVGNDAVVPVVDTMEFTFPFSTEAGTTYDVEVDYEPHNGSAFSTNLTLYSIKGPTQDDYVFSDLWYIAQQPTRSGTGKWAFTIGPGLQQWGNSVTAGERHIAWNTSYKRITGIRFSPQPVVAAPPPPETTPDETIDPQLYDTFAQALLVDYDYGGEEITLRYGSVEAGEPVPAGTVATSWVTWHAEEDEVVNFTFAADDGVEFTVTAFAGGWGNPVGSVTGTNEAYLEVPIVNGTQYWLQFASATTEVDFEVSWELGPTTVEPAEAVEYLRVEVYEEDGLTLISELPRRLSPNGQEPLNEPGSGQVTVHLDDEIVKAYPNILDFGHVIKCFLAHKCIHGFRIKNRKTSYIGSGEWAGYVRTVSGPSVMHLLDDFIVRHDLPGSLQDRTLDVRPFTWAAPPGSWFDATKWDDPYNSSTQTDPPSDFGKAPKERSKWNNPPDFPDSGAMWMWIHPVPEKNQSNFDPPPLRGVRYYRKTITTDAKKLVRLYASADESYTVYLNGEEVLSGSGEETGYAQLEKRKLILPAGQHTIGILQHFNAQVMADGADAVIFTMMEINAKNKPTTVLAHSDGTWMCTHERPVPSWKRTNVLRKVVNEARDRDNQSANRLTFGFTEERDTHGRRWTDYWNREVPIGITALELQKLLSEGNGFDVWVDPGSMELRAWRRRGRDKSKSITLEPGKNLLDWEVEEVEEVRNTFLIHYDRGWTTWRAKGSSRRFGRREAFVEMGRARGDDHARQIMSKASRGVGWAEKRAGVSDIRKRQADQPSGSLIAIQGARPFLDFGVGDIVKAPNENGVLRRHRVIMLSFTEDENGYLTFDPELEEL